MIKINLLGSPKATKTKKADLAKIQLFGGVLAIIFSVLISLYGWYWLNQKIALLTNEKTGKEKELALLKEKVKEIENLEKDKQTLQEKIRIIDQLKKNQSGPVHLLDELSQSLPDRVWVTSFSEQSGNVDLEGKAMSNAELVGFIENLSRSKYFRNIQLIESRSSSDSSMNVFTFKLKFQFFTSL
ncbi:MAG: PilN domain-containing protein [Nitrospiria bacterium]